MKKGWIGSYNLGFLEGAIDALKVAEGVTGQPAVNIEAIFYASAFQAGIERFLVPDIDENSRKKSKFINERTVVVTHDEYSTHSHIVKSVFSHYLPDGWDTNEEYMIVWKLASFISDLIDSMSTGASLLSSSGVPDIAEANALLPAELSTPVANLFSTFIDLRTSCPIPQKVISVGDVEKYNEILLSDLFLSYSTAQGTLDDLEAPRDDAVTLIADRGRKLFYEYKQYLQLRKGIVSIVQISPKIIDAVFGKLPGALAEVLAKLGVEYLDSRRRIVVYDFHDLVLELLMGNLARMVKEHVDKES